MGHREHEELRGEHDAAAVEFSAMAPDASEKIMTGSAVEAWTSATRSAEPLIEVMSQAAPTAWTRLPRLEARLAIHTTRNTG